MVGMMHHCIHQALGQPNENYPPIVGLCCQKVLSIVFFDLSRYGSNMVWMKCPYKIPPNILAHDPIIQLILFKPNETSGDFGKRKDKAIPRLHVSSRKVVGCVKDGVYDSKPQNLCRQHRVDLETPHGRSKEVLRKGAAWAAMSNTGYSGICAILASLASLLSEVLRVWFLIFVQ